MKLFVFKFERILELIAILFLAFFVFSIQFGGLPNGEWIALNLYPVIAGFLTWIVFSIILFFSKMKNKGAKYYTFFLMVTILLVLAFLYLLKKL